MSSRLGQTISRYNAAVGGHLQPLELGCQSVQVQLETPNNGNNGGASSTAAHAMAHQPPPAHYKGHRGHKRGHSYGGTISSTGPHHAQLEARPSHPNTHQGVLLSHGSSALQKGHRRALSGCLPSAVGAVAWSSLRDLDTATSGGASHHHFNFVTTPPIRSLSPEEREPRRPTSPDGMSDLRDGGGGGDKKRKRPMKDDITRVEKVFQPMRCGIGPCHLPVCFQRLANIQFFVCILAVLVTLQQGVASGYVNSVITTIETRFEIPSRFSGLIASSYEMGNVVTVLFVSYLGAKRHIPRWIAIGVLVMVIGCIVFTLPHFLTTDYSNSPVSSGESHHFSNIQRHLDGDASRHNNNANNDASFAYSNYNNLSKSEWNDTDIVSLRQTMTQNHSRSQSFPRPGRNSICHSVNPKSSPFVQGSSHRQNLDQESSSDGDGGIVGVKQELMSVGCSMEVIDKDGTKTTQPTQESYGHPLILFMLAQLLLGCGGSPLFTLGITYVDDHVPPDSSSVYIGSIYAMAAFGPVLGFLIGAWLLSIPSSSSHILNPDSKVIGLWWGGFLMAGGLLLVAALPFLTFPRLTSSKKCSGGGKDEDEESGASSESQSESGLAVVQVETKSNSISGPSTTKQTEQEEGVNSGAYGQSIKDIPHSIWRLITNPTYVLTCLGGCMELNIVSGFVVFLPKYLETQFSLGKSQASLFTGGIAIPGACLGIFFGGWLVKRMQMRPSGACKFVVTTNIICLAGYVLFFFLGCSNPNLAGATVPYPGNPTSNYGSLDINLTSTCNADCSCDSSLDAQYVCHEGVTYFSPCHAGCSINLTQCSCAGGADVTPGPCPEETPCNTLLPFMIILFFMTATVAVTQMPLLMIVLRSVSPEERSFALGMQFVIFRILGYIPSPIVFGNVIDSSCLLWSIKRCSLLLPAVSGRCLLYDIQDFRYKYVGMLSGLKLLALALFLYDLYQLRRLEKEEDEAAALAVLGEDNMKNSSSIISLDKLFPDEDSRSITTITTTATILPAASYGQQGENCAMVSYGRPPPPPSDCYMKEHSHID